MKSSLPFQPIIHPVGVKSTERWSIYYRLQQLGIPCQCSTNKSLQVELAHALAIAQLCSVVRHSTASRSELITWLDDCWKIKCKRKKTKSKPCI